MTQEEFPEFSLMGEDTAKRQKLPGFFKQKPPGYRGAQEDPYFQYLTEVPGKGTSTRPPTTDELRFLDSKGLLFGPDNFPKYPLTDEYRHELGRKNFLTGGLKSAFATTFGAIEAGFELGRQGLEYVNRKYPEAMQPHDARYTSTNLFNIAEDHTKNRETWAEFEKAIANWEAENNKEMGLVDRLRFMDEHFPALAGARGVQQLIGEIALVPALASEKLLMYGATKAVKPIIVKGKEHLPGWGPVQDFISKQKIQEVHAATVPLPQRSDEDLFKASTSIDATFDSFSHEFSILRGTSTDAKAVKAVEARIGKPQEEWTATDIQTAIDDISGTQVELQRFADDINAELLSRDKLGSAAFVNARTGQPFNAKLFRGSGRESVEEVYDPHFVQEAILGDAVYSTSSKEYAQSFGPNLNLVEVSLSNPLVVSSDKQWMKIIRAAGLNSYIPINVDEIAELRKIIIDSGHDGVVIRVPASEMEGKRLINAFGEDQVIDFSSSKTFGLSDVNAKVLDALPDTVVLDRKTYRQLADDLEMGTLNLRFALEELKEAGLITKQADGSYTKSQAKVPEPEAQMVPEPTARTVPEPATARAVPEAPATPTQEIVSVRPKKGENPPGVDETMAKEADEALVNQTEIIEPINTVPITRSLPDPADVIPPDGYIPTYERMWGDRPRQPFNEWFSERWMKFQEMFNDTYWGLRKMQGLAEGNRPVAKGSDRDLITMLTNAPGAMSAGHARMLRVINEIKSVAPNVMPSDLNGLLFILRQKEMLGLYPKRKLPSYTKDGKSFFMTVDDLNTDLAALRSRLSPGRFQELEDAAHIVHRAYWDERERLVEAGIISRALADFMQKNHPYYSPTKYVEYAEKEAGRFMNSRPFTVPNRDIIRLSEEGTEKTVQTPLDVLGEQLIRNEGTITRNSVAKTVVKLALEVKTPGIRKLTPNQKIGSRDTIQFWDEGKLQIYEVPVWIKRETDYLTRGWGTDVASRIVGAVNGVSRAAFTAASPVFIPVNIMADMLTAMITRGVLPWDTAWMMIKSIKSVANDPVALAHRLSGGYQARYFGR